MLTILNKLFGLASSVASEKRRRAHSSLLQDYLIFLGWNDAKVSEIDENDQQIDVDFTRLDDEYNLNVRLSRNHSLLGVSVTAVDRSVPRSRTREACLVINKINCQIEVGAIELLIEVDDEEGSFRFWSGLDLQYLTVSQEFLDQVVERGLDAFQNYKDVLRLICDSSLSVKEIWDEDKDGMSQSANETPAYTAVDGARFLPERSMAAPLPVAVIREAETRKANLAEVRSYRDLHPELIAAHHFCYDLPIYPDISEGEAIVMGVNPGELDSQFQLVPGPTEETFEYDYQAASRRQRGGINWPRLAEEICHTRNVVLTEVFFWSSKGKEEFLERFGRLEQSPHLAFCVRMNKALVTYHQPKFVVLPGLGLSDFIPDHFKLSYVGVERATNGDRLVEHYTDGQRPWFFTKHWTASRGFTTEQRRQIADYIQVNKFS